MNYYLKALKRSVLNTLYVQVFFFKLYRMQADQWGKRCRGEGRGDPGTGMVPEEWRSGC